MKKSLCLLLFCLPGRCWADPSMVYRQVPPQCRMVQMGDRRVIQDSQGFFMGYYLPAPPPSTFVSTPRCSSVSARGYSQTSTGYGYNGFNGYGYNGYGYNGYGYNGYGYNGYNHPFSSHGGYPGQCPSTFSQPSQQPLTQSGWYSFPTTTRSGF